MYRLLIAVKDFESRFPKAFRLLSDSSLFDLISCPSLKELSSREQDDLLSSADGVFWAADLLDAFLLDRMPKLKIVSKMGSGMDNIDLDGCRERGISVVNSRGKNTNAVAEMTLCLMLALLRQLLPLSRAARKGDWNARIPGTELKGKTVGLIGFGMIARRVAELLSPFGVHICAYDPYMDETAAKRLQVTPVSLHELLAVSDIVSVHIPALPENEGMFCRDLFSRMKPGCLFVNCSRGSLVVEEDLFAALRDGVLAGAACDVFRQEPLSAGNPLFSLDPFIGTPHVAGMTAESMEEDSMEIAQKLIAFFSGREVTT